jgi:hypothetical protein
LTLFKVNLFYLLMLEIFTDFLFPSRQ